jgi:hypothetical protein
MSPIADANAPQIRLAGCAAIQLGVASHGQTRSRIFARRAMSPISHRSLIPPPRPSWRRCAPRSSRRQAPKSRVVTVNSLDGQSREDYAADLYKHLGIGSKKDSRGVLLLGGAQGASVQDRGRLRVRACDQRCPRWRHWAGDGSRSAQPRLQCGCTPGNNADCPTHSSRQGCAVERHSG